MNIEYKILDKRLEELWTGYATEGSAAIDLRAMVDELLVIEPNESKLIPSGIAIHINNQNYAAMILPRSSTGINGLVLGNLVGPIDSDYMGQIYISAWNRSNNPIVISPTERIAQMIFVPIVQVDLTKVDEFSYTSNRAENGFGHSGEF